MKPANLKHLKPLRARLASRSWRALACLWLSSLCWTSGLYAATTVDTLTGGPAQNYPSFSGYFDGNTYLDAQFNFPAGLALDSSGTMMFVADYSNNMVRAISDVGNAASSLTSTFADAGDFVSRPIAVATLETNVFVLNRGNGNNGMVLQFDATYYADYGFSILTATNVSGLTNATAMALDGLANMYITIKSNTVIRITPAGGVSTIGVITNAGTSLRGITVLDDGRLALSDAGNHGIWVMNPVGSVSNNATKLTGFHGAGDTNGPSTMAAFNRPEMIAKAGGGKLVVADRGNHKVKMVDVSSGAVLRLYGVSSSLWVPSNPSQGIFAGWYDGIVNPVEMQGSVEAREPFGVVVGPDGTVYTTEVYYHIIRQTTGAGLTGPQPGYLPLFNGPRGIALNTASTHLFIADQMNDAVQVLDLGSDETTTYLDVTDLLSQPVDVELDTNDNLYVLNRGIGGNGYVLVFDPYRNLIDWDFGLTNATALTLDGSGNIFVAEQGGTVHVFDTTGNSFTLATVTNAGVQLQGIALFGDGVIAVSDAGNHVLWQINPLTRVVSRLTGQLGLPGTTLGSNNVARLNQPQQLVRADGNLLVTADSGNNRLVVVNRYGSITNVLNATNSLVWFGRPSDPVATNNARWVRMASPVGVAVGLGGTVYDSEISPNDCIRAISATGLSQPEPGPFDILPFFNDPMGIALDNSGSLLYITDQANNALRLLNFTDDQTTTFTTNAMNRPVGVVVDPNGNIFVLNQGTGADGSIVQFNAFGNLLATNITGLPLPTAMAIDGVGNFYITETNGVVARLNVGSSNTVVITAITNAGTQLGGIVILDDGSIAVSDTGLHVIWLINPVTYAVSWMAGLPNTPGSTLGIKGFAQLNQPRHLAKAAGDLLVVADSGNNRIVTVDRAGSITNVLNSTNSLVWFGRSWDPVGNENSRWVPMAQPVGLAIGSAAVYTSEVLYDDIRGITGTGLSPSGTGGGGASNVLVVAPIVTPISGYYPMGRTIMVQSPNPNVHYTVNGTEPTTNSPAVTMDGNIGYFLWYNTTNDLTGLRVKAFVNTNASVTVSGRGVSVNDIGVPPGPNTSIYAGIGSTIVVPVVVDLRTNDEVRSYQFRVQITPEGGAPMISSQFRPLDVGLAGSDFVPVVTAAQGGGTATITVQSETNGLMRGLIITAVGTNTGIFFKRFAAVAMLAVPIPPTALEGQTYSIVVTNASATSDGQQASVPLTPMLPATILVTNIPYTVGDSAFGGWYNAGGFGNRDLNNADVNNAFYAAAGLRVPYTFSDLYNSMDTYPEDDGSGTAGGDDLIRYLDWQIVLRRSLRLDTNNWQRSWAAGGYLVSAPTTLVPSFADQLATVSVGAIWYRPAKVGALPAGNAIPGNTVDVPVYVKLVNDVTLAGLQFRAIVSPEDGAPPLTQESQFIPATGMATPMQQSFQTAERGVGWSLGSFNFASRSSNYLGVVRFTIPAGAQSGQVYTVGFENADGAPDFQTQFDQLFETKSASIVVGAPVPASDDTLSDEWKSHFFGGTTSLLAAAGADPDGDGVPNWQEYLAGTDPMNKNSRLEFSPAEHRMVGDQRQCVLHWLTAQGRAYEVEWAASPTGDTWHALTTVSGNGTVADLTDTNPTGNTRFYRLRVLP